MTELKWDVPGPGGWQWDSAHSAGPASPALQELLPAAMTEGFQRFTAAYGLPISHIEIRYVNGYAYGAVRLADMAAREVPPPVAAEQALTSRRWRDELRWWREDERPARLASHRALEDVDCSTLDDAALADHLDDVAEEYRRGMVTHFSLVGATAIPVGDFLAHCRQWGLPIEDCLALLVGDHPLTVASAPVRAAIGNTRPESLDALRTHSPAAAQALDDLIAEVGSWGIGRYDVTGRTMREEPAVILAAVLADPPAPSSPELLRGKVPAEDQPVFDELLAEARNAFSARDDHATVGGIGMVGIIRGAMLAVGERLGLGELVFQLSLSELAAALRTRTPVAVLARQRAETFAAAIAAAPPPPVLGDAPTTPPAIEIPGPLGRVITAMFTYIGAMDSGAPVGVGTATARGRAVVAFEPEDAIDRIEPGDILVTTTTTPAFGAVLPMLGGIVAASGGSLSHTAIVARELGIPAVVGLSDALVRIADGVEIEVDAAAGEVRII